MKQKITINTAHILVFLIAVTTQVWADETLKTINYSPICKDQSLIEELIKAREKNNSNAERGAMAKIGFSGCQFVDADTVATVTKRENRVAYILTKDLKGNHAEGFIPSSALENPETTLAQANAENQTRTRREQEKLNQEQDKKRLIYLQNSNKISCKSGKVNGLVSGAGGFMFSPTTIIERSYENPSFREEALDSGMNCVIDPHKRNSYCTGLMQVDSLIIQPQQIDWLMYKQFGENLKDYVTFYQEGSVNGRQGFFQMFARKKDFVCLE